MIPTNEVTATVVPQAVSDIFLAQGFIGAVALILLLCVAFLYRARENDKARFEEKFDQAIAAKDAVLHKLQEDRITEMKAGMIEIGKAMETLRQATAGFEAALEALSKRVAQ